MFPLYIIPVQDFQTVLHHLSVCHLPTDLWNLLKMHALLSFHLKILPDGSEALDT